MYTPERYAHNRDVLFSRLLTFLQADERFVAAWLTGSFGRGVEDNLSDFDLRIVVADAYVKTLAITQQAQAMLIRELCNEMLKVMPYATALGADVPEDPMSVVEVWLSMVQE